MKTLSISTLALVFSCLSLSSNAIEVHGHRGARWMRPENTLPAFQYALESGADVLELDMFVTKDNQVVVTHDGVLNSDLCLDSDGKKLTGKILVRSLTLQELKAYDCGSLVNPRFPTQQPVPKTPIPTLDEVFSLVETSQIPKAKTVRFNIETKSEEKHPDWTPSPKDFVRLVFEVVKRHKMTDRIILQTLDYRTLDAARALYPRVTLAIGVKERPKSSNELVKLAKKYGAQILQPNYEWLNEKDVEQLHAAGIRVVPWTPNQAGDWQNLIDMKVDGIITDNPKALLEMLSTISSEGVVRINQPEYLARLKERRMDLIKGDCKANLIAKPEYRSLILNGSSISSVIKERYSEPMRDEDKIWADEYRRPLQNPNKLDGGYRPADYYNSSDYVGYLVGAIKHKMNKNLLTHPFIDSRGIGYKVFFQLKNFQADLRAHEFELFAKDLANAGFRGDLKVQLQPENMRFKFNNIVVHAASQNDSLIAERAGLKFFAGKLAGISRGVDVDVDPHGNREALDWSEFLCGRNFSDLPTDVRKYVNYE